MTKIGTKLPDHQNGPCNDEFGLLPKKRVTCPLSAIHNTEQGLISNTDPKMIEEKFEDKEAESLKKTDLDLAENPN